MQNQVHPEMDFFSQEGATKRKEDKGAAYGNGTELWKWCAMESMPNEERKRKDRRAGKKQKS